MWDFAVFMNKLKQLREQRGYTQGQLANKSHVPKKTIQALEQGTRSLQNARGETLLRLAEAIGCSIEDLLK